jgi:hypothetical protein
MGNEQKVSKSKSWTTPYGIVAVAIGLYVGAYFVLSKGSVSLDMSGTDGRLYYHRSFNSPIHSFAFSPIGWLECKLREIPVDFTYPSNDAPGWEEIEHEFEP